MSNEQLTCRYCKNTFPNSRTNCPHCALPQLFPNVSNAESPKEKQKLEDSFLRKQRECAADGRRNEFDRFHAAASNSHAQFACPLLKLHREIAAGTDIFETYYQLEELRLRATAHPDLDWDKLRPQAEIELLGSHQNIERLHYACLSLDWESLVSYGDCLVRLDESKISHRASCFQGNTAVLFFLEGSFAGFLRSTWEDRGKIAVTIAADRLPGGAPDTEFAKILVARGKDRVDDEFIEVHVFGTMTVRTFAEVKFLACCGGRRESVYRDAIIEKLDQANIKHA